MPAQCWNWYFGWGLILAGFASGAVLGLFFHRDDFLGGYQSFRRRIIRLGHIALVALGMLNVLFAISPWPTAWSADGVLAARCFIIGGVAMPAVCFLTGWKDRFRFLFFIPVTALVLAVVFTLRGGPS
jgi:hypothetical protein